MGPTQKWDGNVRFLLGEEEVAATYDALAELMRVTGHFDARVDHPDAYRLADWRAGSPARLGIAVAFRGENLAGAAFVEAFWRHGVIWRVAVAPEFEGRGAGRALVAFALDELFRAGAERVQLFCRVDNHRAAQLYESLGFTPDSGTYACWAKSPREPS